MGRRQGKQSPNFLVDAVADAYQAQGCEEGDEDKEHCGVIQGVRLSLVVVGVGVVDCAGAVCGVVPPEHVNEGIIRKLPVVLINVIRVIAFF